MQRGIPDRSGEQRHLFSDAFANVSADAFAHGCANAFAFLFAGLLQRACPNYATDPLADYSVELCGK
jgi:hypothetical protein